MTHAECKKLDFEFPVLLADIGGTNARFSLLTTAGEAAHVFSPAKTAAHADIQSAIRSLEGFGTDFIPKTAIIAVAGPVTAETIALTNAHWVIEPRKMIEDLGFSEVVILNDFEAQALALPVLGAEDVIRIGGAETCTQASKFVLGPGTGLGAAAMVHACGTWIPVAGEGGHIELGPVSEEDYAIWPYIERHNGRIGAEQILSGSGMPRLAAAVAAYLGQERQFEKAAQITSAAQEGDPVAVMTLQAFARALGRVAGDLALAVLARGGVYLAGGVTPHIMPYLKTGDFRKAFEAKAPHEDLMNSIATFIVTHPNPALEGLGALARWPETYSLDIANRRWSRKDSRKN